MAGAATAVLVAHYAFTMPWSAVQRYRKGEKRPMTELSCAENNFDFLGYDVVPLPISNRPDF